ncbi:DUF1177 family protein [Xylophilus rhododendri]|uniref:DUF1177 family protein n=1 Tax=Xylophilus rhododendri TaxID=2697032 RepID=A0A857J1V6_9BURK|nr:DUF1177 domain-containing protein [Xylophilus rhododendri]QHI97696.1 DUF1177 family protein [Xylophilus rhododendri]
MALKQVLEAFELLSSAHIDGEQVAALLRSRGVEDVTVTRVQGETTATDFLACTLPGRDPTLPALGIVGRLGGLGARPGMVGLVSDADGGIVAVAAALKLADMAAQGDLLPGPMRIHTHICPTAATRPNSPVPMMRSPLPARQMMAHEVHPEMAAILCVDTTRGNRLVNRRGVALTPVVRQGWILPLPDMLLDLIGWVSGELPVTLPLTMQDITPQENGLTHINSILQPATASPAPVVGVALTAQTTVPGCATGVSNAGDIDVATRFCIEVAKAFGAGHCAFYDAANAEALIARYGPMTHLQTLGATP